MNALRGHRGYVWQMIQITDGRIASASSDGTVRLWDVILGDADNVLEGHKDEVTDLIQITDGRIVSCSADNTMRIWTAPATKIRENVKGRKVSPPEEPPTADMIQAARRQKF
jgi:WD40 repeat protein